MPGSVEMLIIFLKNGSINPEVALEWIDTVCGVLAYRCCSPVATRARFGSSLPILCTGDRSHRADFLG